MHRSTLTRRALLAACAVPAYATLLRSASAANKGFATELRLGVDRTRVKGDRFRAADEARLKAVLTRRLPMLADTGGSVEIASVDDIRVRAPVAKVEDVQVRALLRPALLEIRYLEGLRSTLNPDGRYLMDALTIQEAGGTRTALRFLDTRSNTRMPAAQFLERCPLILTNADLTVDSAEAFGSGENNAVRIRFNEAGTKRLEGFMKKPGRLLAVVLDGDLITVNAVVQKVRRRKKETKEGEGENGKGGESEVGQIEIAGSLANEGEAAYLAMAFNAGALPVPLKLLGSRLVAE